MLKKVLISALFAAFAAPALAADNNNVYIGGDIGSSGTRRAGLSRIA